MDLAAVDFAADDAVVSGAAAGDVTACEDADIQKDEKGKVNNHE